MHNEARRHTKELLCRLGALVSRCILYKIFVPDVSVEVERRNGHFDAFAVGGQKVEAHQKAAYREKRVHDDEPVQQNHRVQPLVVLQNYKRQ